MYSTLKSPHVDFHSNPPCLYSTVDRERSQTFHNVLQSVIFSTLRWRYVLVSNYFARLLLLLLQEVVRITAMGRYICRHKVEVSTL